MQKIENGVYGDIEPLDFGKMAQEQQKAREELTGYSEGKLEAKSLEYEIVQPSEIEEAKKRIGQRKATNGNKRKKTRRNRKVLAQ